nr:MAG TPA: hypothetical protein [Caudoviricetes sp.]
MSLYCNKVERYLLKQFGNFRTGCENNRAGHRKIQTRLSISMLHKISN